MSAADFAAERGWKILSGRWFTPRMLYAGSYVRTQDDWSQGDPALRYSEHLDHAEYFWQLAARAHVPVGIVAHLYDDRFAGHAKWADHKGLTATPLPRSWRLSGRGLAVLYMRRPEAPDAR